MSSYNTGGNDGYPMVDIDSDDERAQSSSDDDIDVILHGTPEQKRKLRRKSLGQDSSSEDDFEKEMEGELNATMKKFEAAQRLGTSTSQAATSADDQIDDKEQKFYEDEYFDSDEENPDSSESNTKEKRKHPVVSNDDLFYDPMMDDDDQNWVDSQRRKYQPKIDKKTKSKGPKPLPHSDAVLNCPACMTLLCLDCQRHSLYNNQYRAMFVQNCKADDSEVLKYPKIGDKSNKKKKQKTTTHSSSASTIENNSDALIGQCPSSSVDNTDQDTYHPVRCNVCTTEVGVLDNDEVFHFFNVLASYS